MPVNRRITKFIPVALAAAAMAAPVGIAAQSEGVAAPAAGAQPVGAQTGIGQVCSTTSERGYPSAVPPILPPPPCSALAAIKREQAFDGQEFWHDPPASARYSNAEMNAYASKSK
jgi:hypothetical protein